MQSNKEKTLLTPPDAAWKKEGAHAVRQLKTLLGGAARGVEHVGSTAVGIWARPVLDIALAADMPRVRAKKQEMEKAGFLLREDNGTEMVFVREGTFPVRVLALPPESMAWQNCINFRNYLRAFPKKAAGYEKLKKSLWQQFPYHPAAYEEGKRDFVEYACRKAMVWHYLGREVRVETDRPIGTPHPKHPEIIYPINYGFIPGVLGGDGEELDVYILGPQTPVKEFYGQVVGIVHRENDVEDKLVAAPLGSRPNQAEMAQAVAFQEQFYISHIEPLFPYSCGAVLFRRRGKELLFLVLLQRESKTWSFPKGHAEAGETPQETALREVAEEVGAAVSLAPGFRETVTYPLRSGGEKTVTLFLAELLETQETAIEEVMLEARWAKQEEAARLLRHPGYRRVLKRAVKAIKEGNL